MKKNILLSLAAFACPVLLMAQGWPANWQGVMLQGFYWNSYDATNWKKLESQADELSQYFKLVWIPQSANCGGESMGYDDLYWFNDYKSAFGTEQELRSMISTFKQKGLGTIADVVINHRKNVSNWVDFPAETYKGITYQLQSTDICADDDGGKTAAWAKSNGYSLSSNNDTGTGWDGMRDLDHNSLNVQANVKAYLDFLLNDLGYAGVRYDMTKGYDAKFTGIYNVAAKPEYSVGEYWDDAKQKVENWIDGTAVDGEKQSAAFDFPLRYSVRDAVNYTNWTKLKNGGLATDQNYARYAVTFVENHDTEKREDAAQDPIKSDTLAANAYMLAMPGTPCVFLKHWIDCKADIKNMIMLRNLAGIHNQSQWECVESSVPRYVLCTTGNNGRLMAAVGTTANSYVPETSVWALAAEGTHYRYFLERTTETAWTSLPSGEYFNATSVILRAISTDDDARIVYTLDGTAPNANSVTVENGAVISLPDGETTLRAAILSKGMVKGEIERKYNVKSFKPYSISVNVNTEEVGWNSMNVWSWGGDGSHSTSATSWPGDNVATMATLGGKSWYTMNYTMNSSDDYVNFVFNSANGSVQTVNVQNVNATSYFVVSAEKDSQGHYLVNDVTADYVTGIGAIELTSEGQAGKTVVSTLAGQTVRRFATTVSLQDAVSGLPAGVYVVNGKKIVK